MRIDKDSLGEMSIPDDALYGIHALRARENFPDDTRFSLDWYKAVGTVKLACYLAYRKFKAQMLQRFREQDLQTPLLSDTVIDGLIDAAKEVAAGKHFAHFIVPAISGGAGTSINMNVNEIIANLASRKLSVPVDPVEAANVFQSTNDVIPTALRVACMQLFDQLEAVINALRMQIEPLENQHRASLRVAFTQLQEAVPSSYGKLLSCYNEALSRDWWRVSKCFERIKVANLGGNAVGTGLSVPKPFIFSVIECLRDLTKKPLTRGENLEDATSNLDTFVEIHATLKAHAVSLEKMVSDLRLLASDFRGRHEVSIPKRQVGSSIMPGKVNPVIPEFVISSCHRIYANDLLITSLCGQGQLDLNAYLPAIGHAMLESLRLLIACDQTVKDHLICGMEIHSQLSSQNLFSSPSIATVLVPYVGYNNAALVAKRMREGHLDVFTANDELKLIDANKLQEILAPDRLLQLGLSLEDMVQQNMVQQNLNRQEK